MKNTKQKKSQSKSQGHKFFNFAKAHLFIFSSIAILCVATGAGAAIKINNASTTKSVGSTNPPTSMANEQNAKPVSTGTSYPPAAKQTNHESNNKTSASSTSSSSSSKSTITSTPKKSTTTTTPKVGGSISCDPTKLGNASYTDDGTYTTYTTTFTLITHGYIIGSSLTYEIAPVQNGAPGGQYQKYTSVFKGQTNIVLKAKIADVVLQQPSDHDLWLDFNIYVTSNTSAVTGSCGMETSGENTYATPPYHNYWP